MKDDRDHFASVTPAARIGIYLATLTALVVALGVGGAGLWVTLLCAALYAGVAIAIEVRRRTQHRSVR
jgi:fatty acid desaturase